MEGAAQDLELIVVKAASKLRFLQYKFRATDRNLSKTQPPSSTSTSPPVLRNRTAPLSYQALHLQSISICSYTRSSIQQIP